MGRRYYQFAYALFEQTEDGDCPYVVALYIPAFMAGGINPETGKDTAEEMAEEWVKTGVIEGGNIKFYLPIDKHEN